MIASRPIGWDYKAFAIVVAIILACALFDYLGIINMRYEIPQTPQIEQADNPYAHFYPWRPSLR